MPDLNRMSDPVVCDDQLAALSVQVEAQAILIEPLLAAVAALNTQMAVNTTALSAQARRLSASLNTCDLSDYDALRAYTGAAYLVYITGSLVAAQPSGIAGTFIYDSTDTVSLDNGGTVIVSADGKRWKRQHSGEIYAAWFGVNGDGITSDTVALSAALNYCGATKARLHLYQNSQSNVNIIIDDEILLPNWFDIFAEKNVTLTFTSVSKDRGFVSKAPVKSRIEGVIFQTTGQVNQYLCCGQDLSNAVYTGTNDIEITRCVFYWANATAAMQNPNRYGGLYFYRATNIKIRDNEFYDGWRDHTYNCSNYGGNNLVHTIYVDNQSVDMGYVYFQRNTMSNIWTAAYFKDANEVFCDENDVRDTADTVFFDRCTGGITYRKRFRYNTVVNAGKSVIKALDANNCTGKGHYAWVIGNYIENWGLYLKSGAIMCANYFDYNGTNQYLSAPDCKRALGFNSRDNDVVETAPQSCGQPYQLINLLNPILSDRVAVTNETDSYSTLFQFCTKPQMRGGSYKNNKTWGLYSCTGAILDAPDFETYGPIYADHCNGIFQWLGGQLKNQDLNLLLSDKVYGLTAGGTPPPTAIQVNAVAIVVPIPIQDNNTTTNTNIFAGFSASTLNADNIAVSFSDGVRLFKTAAGTLKHGSYYSEVPGASYVDATNNKIDIAMSATRSDFKSIALGADITP